MVQVLSIAWMSSNYRRVAKYESSRSVRVEEDTRIRVKIINEFMVVDFVKAVIREGCK